MRLVLTFVVAFTANLFFTRAFLALLRDFAIVAMPNRAHHARRGSAR